MTAHSLLGYQEKATQKHNSQTNKPHAQARTNKPLSLADMIAETEKDRKGKAHQTVNV